MLDPDQPGIGALGDLGSHLIDAALWLRSGVLHVQHANLDHVQGIGVDVAGTATLAWHDEVPLTVRASWQETSQGLRIALRAPSPRSPTARSR